MGFPGAGTGGGGKGGGGDSAAADEGGKSPAANLGGKAGGSAIQGAGGKKAAEAGQPQIPEEFAASLNSALDLLDKRLLEGFPTFPGQLSAPLNPLTTQALGQGGDLLTQGGPALQEALKTIQGVAESGLSPELVRGAEEAFRPLFDIQRERTKAQSREASAQGGRFFGTGAVEAENRALGELAAAERAEIFKIAPELGRLQLGAAQSIPGFLGGGAGALGGFANLGELARVVEQAGLDREFAEFIRTQPENAIPFLASLLQGTPLFFPPIAPNFAQIFGGQLTSASTQPGFFDFLKGSFSPGAGSEGGSRTTGDTLFSV